MVPPSVITRMLLILCYHGYPHKQQEFLDELNVLLHHDDGQYVNEFYRDISWQILGICQQVCGDHQGALRSYQISLQQQAIHEIQQATLYRIQNVQNCMRVVDLY
jgi:hypothetical protein